MTTPGTTAQTLTQVKIGDAPASRVIDFEVTPNRPDCMGVEGIARELLFALKVTVDPAFL